VEQFVRSEKSRLKRLQSTTHPLPQTQGPHKTALWPRITVLAAAA
jgi:hypothetical protein